MEADRITQFNTSGRLSLNRTVRNNFRLVIYGILQSDSGTYSCSVDIGYDKQHVTVLNVTGIYCNVVVVVVVVVVIVVVVVPSVL